MRLGSESLLLSFSRKWQQKRQSWQAKNQSRNFHITRAFETAAKHDESLMKMRMRAQMSQQNSSHQWSAHHWSTVRCSSDKTRFFFSFTYWKNSRSPLPALHFFLICCITYSLYEIITPTEAFVGNWSNTSTALTMQFFSGRPSWIWGHWCNVGRLTQNSKTTWLLDKYSRTECIGKNLLMCASLWCNINNCEPKHSL